MDTPVILSEDIDVKRMEIRLANPEKRIIGKERKSKLLEPGSEFFSWIQRIRAKIHEEGIEADCRDPHIEVIREKFSTFDEEEAVVAARSNQLQGRYVNAIEDIGVMSGKALVCWTGSVDGYGMTHATIAYFGQGISEEMLKLLLAICRDS
jgi:hypothetical protein